MTARRGYPAVDRFRVAAALLVVCIHTAPLASFSAAADFALKTLARLAVPFFFTATGFFLLGELVRPGLRPRTLSPGVRRFLKKTGVLYAACTVLYLPVTLYARNFPVKNLTKLIWPIFILKRDVSAPGLLLKGELYEAAGTLPANWA